MVFTLFTLFFIIPTLYWFFGEISKCPRCGTKYAFKEIRRDYDHALAPKYARNIMVTLKKIGTAMIIKFRLYIIELH